MQSTKQKLEQVNRNFAKSKFAQATNTASIQDELERKQYRNDLFGTPK